MSSLWKINKLLSISIAIVFFTNTALTSTLTRNGKIAFASDRDGNFEIYSMNSDGTGLSRLTNSVVTDDYPTWSPDGRKIAFIRSEGNDGRRLLIMNADGSDIRSVTTLTITGVQSYPYERFGMSWSPDGSKIVFQDRNDLFVIGSDGTNRASLTNGQFINFEPSWSPDGSLIAFARSIFEHGFYADIYTMNPQGGNVARVLASLPYSESRYPSWSPDGNSIILGTGAEDMDDPSLAMVNRDGTDLRFLLNYATLGYSIIGPKSAPDGTKVIFAAPEGDPERCQIWAFDRSSSTSTRLTNHHSINIHADWQPISSSAVTISGRVLSPNGAAIRNARVSLTDSLGGRLTATTSSFGNYTFENVTAGSTYVVTAASKRYRFAPRSITVTGNLSGIDLIGEE